MTVGSGIQKSFGFGFETTFGVPVAPTVHVPLIDESLGREVARLMSKGVIAGQRVARTQQWSPGDVTVGGDVQLEVYDRSIGKLLRAMFGTVVTAGAGPYTHTYTLGDLDDDFGCVQIGRPDLAGTVQPFTYPGGMVDSWEIACAAGEVATLGITWVARDEILYRALADGATTNASPTVTSATGAFGPDDVGKPISGTGIPASSYVGVVNSATSVGLSSSHLTNTPVNATATASGVALVVGVALTSPSYSAGIRPMTYTGGSVTIAGTAAAVKSISLGSGNGLAKERRFLGDGRIRQPKEVELREVGGDITMEFENLTQYKRYVNGEEFAMVFTLAAGAQTLAFTSNIRYDGSTPTISGREVGEIELPYVCVGTTTDASALTAVFTTTESTP